MRGWSDKVGLALDITELRVTSDRDRVLLSLPDLAVAPGETLGVRGPSGAGKSTLLYALAGLAEHMTGAVCWGETDLVGLGAAQRARFRRDHVGMIFQDFMLFEELSAAANAALPALYAPRTARADWRARAEAHLTALGIEDSGRSVASFSGGERQRVAIARALAGAPEVLLADEPTASLHREAADRLIADLVALTHQEGRTLIAVSHDTALLDQMDRVLTVTDGQVQGT